MRVTFVLSRHLSLCIMSLFGSFCVPAIGQKYEGLVDSLANRPEIIMRRPIRDLGLERRDLKEYIMQMKEDMTGGDTSVLLQLVEKSSHPDTTAWTAEDFRYPVFVDSIQQHISMRDAVSLLKSKGCLDLRPYKKIIRKYNYAFVPTTIIEENEPGSRRSMIIWYSRPILDDSGTYAIIARHQAYEKDEVCLYHREGGVWRYGTTLLLTRY